QRPSAPMAESRQAALADLATADAAPSSTTVTPSGTTKDPMALGVFLRNPFAYVPGDPNKQVGWKLDQYASLVGGSGAPIMPRILMWYQPWGFEGDMTCPTIPDNANPCAGFYTSWFNAVVSRGVMPIVTWEPWAGRRNDSAWSLDSIINGAHDAYITNWAVHAASWGKESPANILYLRFAHEMNGFWSPWALDVNGNTPGKFRSAWRHVWTLFQAQGADNVRWLWSPNQPRRDTPPIGKFYPGDSYVNEMGFSAYNWGSSRSITSWVSMSKLIGKSMTALTAVSATKNVIYIETGSVEQGGNKAKWIRNGFAYLKTAYPRLHAIVWFHANREDVGSDFRIDTSTSSLAAFRTIAAWPEYRGRLN
ncbi:MAG: glycosyl hydrolase, partial [Candidatus Limnocylindrales bacterium]